ncbi:MAG TPA: MnhB domain-containing protein [Candidatus Limiplasma sp.]|nr:MnhB domain-containing protein [Candidatus Limiplasma sp.]
MKKKIADSLRKRFYWELSPLDEDMIASLSEKPHELTRSSNEALEVLEDVREVRVQRAQEQEQEMYRQIHRWSHASGVKIIRSMYRVLAAVTCLGIVLFLLWTVNTLPPFGEPDNPYNNEVFARYVEWGPDETGAVNMVTGMILDYRAFDTFGEASVLFVAACSVLFLLKLHDHKDGKPTKTWLEAEYDDRFHEPKNDQILQFAAKLMVPVVLLFGFYVILNGHITPGGGFSGGAIMGAGLILYLNAYGFKKTERFFTYRTFQWITFGSLLTYAGLKSYSFYTGANHLESFVSPGTPGNILSAGFILPLNLCVGLVVMCTMYVFYTLIRKGGV